MVIKDLIISRKTTPTYEITFKTFGIIELKENGITILKNGGTVVDITGWTVYFTVKTSMSASDANAIISKDIITFDEPTLGKAEVELSATDTDRTGNYVYDVKYKDGDGNTAIVLAGRILLSEVVTRRE